MEKPVILVVEDNQTQQKVIALLAEEFGYKVILAGSGQEALEQARRPENQFTLVLMDIALPDFDGLICTQKYCARSCLGRRFRWLPCRRF